MKIIYIYTYISIHVLGKHYITQLQAPYKYRAVGQTNANVAIMKMIKNVQST